MPKGLEGVCIKKHECYDAIEKLYYSYPDYELICIQCASTTLSTPLPADHYPQCVNCDSKSNTSKHVAYIYLMHYVVCLHSGILIMTNNRPPTCDFIMFTDGKQAFN